MARTRRIDDVDQKILGLLNGQTRKTNQDKGYWTEKEKKRGYRYYYSHTSGDVKQVVRDLEEAYGEVYKLPTIRYRLDKLVDMGEIERTGNCGWGRSYTYRYITDEVRLERAKKKANAKFREEFASDLRDMLTAVGIRVDEDAYIDRHGDIEVNAADLARILRENYSFESELENESKSA